jgi:hypothetical protein
MTLVRFFATPWPQRSLGPGHTDPAAPNDLATSCRQACPVNRVGSQSELSVARNVILRRRGRCVAAFSRLIAPRDRLFPAIDQGPFLRSDVSNPLDPPSWASPELHAGLAAPPPSRFRRTIGPPNICQPPRRLALRRSRSERTQ